MRPKMPKNMANPVNFPFLPGAPLPKPPPPAWIPGRENRPFRGVNNKGGVIEKFILNSIPRVRDPDRPLESVASILTDYFASSLLGVSRRK